MDVGGLLARFAPPPGDAAGVRAAAEAWHRAAGELQGLADRGGIAVAGVSGQWRGPARQAFDRQWHAFSGGLGEGAAALREGAQALDRTAEAIESAHARYLQLMAASAATVAVGLLLTPLTLGASDVVADGAVAGEVALLLAALAETLGVEAATLAAVAG